MDGDAEQEFREFVAARMHALFRMAYALTGHQQGAEDLLQSALAKTAGRWRRIRHHPEPYTRKIIFHDYVSWWRRRRFREVSVAQVPDRADGVDVTHLPMLRLSLQQALRRLAPRQRAVLVLRYLEDLSERQGAEIMGCTESTVGSQTLRALARLRQVAPELRELLSTEEVSG